MIISYTCIAILLVYTIVETYYMIYTYVIRYEVNYQLSHLANSAMCISYHLDG